MLAVVGIVLVVACSEADHGAYSGSQEEARGVATSSYQEAEAAAAWGRKKPCWMHWGCADY